MPIVAGVAAMRYKTFMFYNLICGLLWTLGITLLGYYLGRVIKERSKIRSKITLKISRSRAPTNSHQPSQQKSSKIAELAAQWVNLLTLVKLDGF
jgi:membrane-associated protein